MEIFCFRKVDKMSLWAFGLSCLLIFRDNLINFSGFWHIGAEFLVADDISRD